MTDSLSSKLQRQEAKQEGMKRDKICQLKPFGEEKKGVGGVEREIQNTILSEETEIHKTGKFP